jgi:geranylgeranyl pyrophosphate synthase
MNDKYSLRERCNKILEDNGGKIADRARAILLEDPALKGLQPPLEFISKNWRDPLTPALMRLSCEAVGGRPEETYEAALAMSLMSLSLYIWDDMIDKAPLKLFKPTLFGEFGEGTALVIGGLASAKAFSILNQMNIEKEKHQTIIKLFWDFLVKMARAETVNLRLRSQKSPSSKEKFWKIRTETSDLETCLRIGAILGGGSTDELHHLGRYGLCLGIILELWKDFHVSLNLTLELAQKIKKGALPFALLWASEHSERIQRKLDRITTDETIEQVHIKQIVEAILETGVLDNTVKTMKRFAKKGREELMKMKKSDATRALQLVIEAQPQLFIESLPTLQKCYG